MKVGLMACHGPPSQSELSIFNHLYSENLADVTEMLRVKVKLFLTLHLFIWRYEGNANQHSKHQLGHEHVGNAEN